MQSLGGGNSSLNKTILRMLLTLLSNSSIDIQVDKASIKTYLLPLLRDNSPHSILLMDVICIFANRKDCIDDILVAAARFAESSKLSSKQNKKLLHLLTLLVESSDNVDFFIRSSLLHRIFVLGQLGDSSLFLPLFSFIALLVEHRTTREPSLLSRPPASISLSGAVRFARRNGRQSVSAREHARQHHSEAARRALRGW